MINEDFDLSDMSNIDYTDTFADIDDNAMKETVQKFIDEYVRIAYLDNNWKTVWVEPSFGFGADNKIILCMPDGAPLKKYSTVQITPKNISILSSGGPVYDSIQTMINGMQLANLSDTNFHVLNMDIRHLYGMPDSVHGFYVDMCPYLEDLSGIPKIVNGDLKLQLHDTTYVNKMPEHIRNLYIGDGFFNLSKETIDLLPYDIQYIKVRMFNKTDYNPEIIKLLKSHVSASIDIIK